MAGVSKKWPESFTTDVQRRRTLFRQVLVENLERRDLMAFDVAGPIFAQGTDPAYVQQWIDRLAGRSTGSGGGQTSFAAAAAPINLNGTRWTDPTGGPSQNEGDPATVSWSIVPDGTLFGTTVQGSGNSDLIAYMDSIYGTAPGPLSNRPWFPLYSDTYDRWAELTGLTFVYEAADDGVPLDTANRGVTGIRGDVRISGRNIDGNSNVLAFNFFPNVGGNDGLDGDMVIDTADNFFQNTSLNSRGLFNVLMHESGHGIGLDHVIPVNQTKLMEPIVSLAYVGPQHDDILAAQTLYGDDREKPNDPPVDLGFLNNTRTTYDTLSIDRNSDTDLYQFRAESKGRLTVKVTPVGQQYLVGPQGGAAVPVDTLINQNLSFELLDSLGAVVATASSTPAGQVEQVVRFAIPTGGLYQVRIAGTPGETQLYELELTSSGFVVNGVAPEPPRLLSIAPNANQLLDPNAGNVSTANVLSESPRELVFRFNGSQAIDAASLTGIRITRTGGDNDFANGSILVTPNYLGFGDNDRIVIARFGEPLPDDRYRIEILGVSDYGLPAVQNQDEQLFKPRLSGTDRDIYYMNLELGAKVVAVVPQPVVRQANGSLVQQRNQIDVYFNDDDLSKTSAETTAFYKLVLTRDSVNSTDDVVFEPTSVVYDAAADKAILTFATALDILPGVNGNGTFRLRIGSNRSAIPVVPVVTPLGIDTGDTFSSASSLIGPLTSATSRIINEQIVATQKNKLLNDYPGSNFEPGHRDIQDESHIRLGADSNPFTTKRFYSFLLNQQYGLDSLGRPVSTAISDLQKLRVREVFELYSSKLGIDFSEVTGLTGPDGSPAIQVVVGDLLSTFVGSTNGPGIQVARTALDALGTPNLVILDGAEAWDNDFGYGTQADSLLIPIITEFGRSYVIQGPALNNTNDPNGPNFFVEAMRSIGLILGLGESHDLPPGTVQASEPTLGRTANPLEQIFPGDHDVVHGQHLYRPDNRDVDLYGFSLPVGQRGTVVAEAFAERLADSSSLDTHLKLYKRNTSTQAIELLSANNNYFSSDALIRLELTGEANVDFFLSVTASGNEDYDPSISGSGSGGLSDGRYQLRFDYQPAPASTLSDLSGTQLDGDGDGIAGGDFNHWFRAVTPVVEALPGAPRTLFVDKDNRAANPNGTLANPYPTISSALNAAQIATADRAGDVVRVIGSAGLDRNLVTTNDNLAYQIGDGGPGIGTLSDGRDLNVPRGVNLVIDAGAIFKFISSHIQVGSSDASVDRGGASIQVLGTPTQSVYFTSFNDESLGVDTNPIPTLPSPGNWGGIEIRNDVARDQGRFDPELTGVFLNYVAMADIRYGGGSVGQGTQARVISPIYLNTARPTLLHNRITQSADAGISADPNSFEETLFTETRYQFGAPFTPDYSRVGPVIRGNRISESSTNGLFVRIDTLPGQNLEPLDVAARFDDADITYVLGENLIINGTPGGSVVETVRPDLSSVQLGLATGGNLPVGQSFQYRITFVDRSGFEGVPSNPVQSPTTTATQKSIDLTVLPQATGDFVRRRVYRSNVSGTWDLLVELDRNSNAYRDSGRAPLVADIDIAPGNTAQLRDAARPDVTAVAAPIRQTGGSLGLQANVVYQYRLTVVNANGNESLPSDAFVELNSPFVPTVPGATDVRQSLFFSNLPTVSNGSTRHLYRSNPASLERWDLVAVLNATDTIYTDTGLALAEGLVLPLTGSLHRPRTDASLVIDPGIVFKSQGSRIEVGMNAQLIAEGTPSKPIIFTSRLDDRYGAGLTFDANNDLTASAGLPGNWSGIFASHLSTLSLDSALVTFAGGISRVAGGFATFNAVEIHEADARIANSTIERNASGAATPGTTRRAARGVNDAAAIYVSGSQPIIVNNSILKNDEIVTSLLTQTSQNGESAAISIDANSLKAVPLVDYGRSLGLNLQIETRTGNRGPLVSGNRLGQNAINGMRVRGATITTETVWDDTDIVHVLQKEIVVPDFHTYGGVRLQSNGDEGLVVKLSGSGAGFTATGRALDIPSRIGGSLQIIGAPGFPVVLTSLKDDSVGAGFDFAGRAMLDTNNDLDLSAPLPGDWRSIRLDAFTNDRNVETTFEYEVDPIGAEGTNDTPPNAQNVGSISPNVENGDENIRFGFTTSGTIAAPGDVDVYRFEATPGSAVWIDIDRTSARLDTVVELIAADGTIIAMSDNSIYESEAFATGTGLVPYFNPIEINRNRVFPLDQGSAAKRNANAPTTQVDFQGINPLDAGLRVQLPGDAGTVTNYFVRVRSSSVRPGDPNPTGTLTATSFRDGQYRLDNKGLTSGAYRLQVRLQQIDEIAGSTVRYSDIRYATIGIDTSGVPLHSPLLGEFAEADQEETDASPTSNISIAEQLKGDRSATSIAGKLASISDIDWYRFTINRDLSSELSSLKHQSTIFDIDYADGLGRPDTSLWVFRADGQGNPIQLVLLGRDSDILDDRAAAGRGADTGDITRGSFGRGDAFIGAQELPAGNYVVAVTNASVTADALDQFSVANPNNPLVRLEPIDSLRRISEDRFETNFASPAAPPKQVSFSNTTINGVYQNAVPYTLADVTAFVARDNPTATRTPNSQLLYANPQTGAKEAEGGNQAGGGIFTRRITDLAAAPDGSIFGPAFPPITGVVNDLTTGFFVGMQADGTTPVTNNVGITTNETFQTADAAFTTRRASTPGTNTQNGIGITFTATTFADDGNDLTMFGVAQRGADSFSGDQFVGQPFDEAIIVRGPGNAPTQVGVSFGTGVGRNILYRLDPNDQGVISPPGGNLGNRTGDAVITGTGTSEREYGVFADVSSYIRRSQGFADTIEVRREATGNIMGLVEIGTSLYGVTDEGELWRMSSTNYQNGFGGATLVSTELPVGLTGLTKGPRNIALPQSKTEYILSSSWRVNGGTFTLRYLGQNTTSLNFDATADDVRLALEALPTIGAGNVNVVGGDLPDSPLSISFINALAGTTFPVSIVAQNLTETTSPVARLDLASEFFFGNVFQLKIPTTATGGTYTLNFEGNSMVFPYNASSFAISSWLVPLVLSVQNRTVQVTTGSTPGTINIVFGGTALPNPVPFALTDSSLTSTPVPILATITRQQLLNYSSLMISVMPNGELHAFDVNGLEQKIFAGGKSSTLVDDFTSNGPFFDSTSTLSFFGSFGSDVQGIDLSAIDVNLWHLSTERTFEAGHGQELAFNGSHLAGLNAGASLHFGFQDNNSQTGRQSGNWGGIYDLEGADGTIDNTYNLPGGVRGAVESNPIDLSEYTSDDQPTLYFNYFAATENSNSSLIDINRIMQDSLRVYGYSPDGRWVLLATNNSANNGNTGLINQFAETIDEFDVPVSGYQDRFGKSSRTNELFDQTAGWRQARVNLGPLAGFRDARIRFEFSSTGDFRTGDPLRGGIELTAISGDRIKSGDTFSLVDNTVFSVPVVHEFKFDIDGTLPAAPNVIPVMPKPSVIPGGAPVPLTAAEVRDQIRFALARVLNGDVAGQENVIPYPAYQNTLRVYNMRVQNPGPLYATTNRNGDKFAAYSTVFSQFDPLTGLSQLSGIKDYQRVFQGGRNNAFEGIYIDDIIVGFAERGEQVFLAPRNASTGFDNTPFYELYGAPGGFEVTQTEVGNYQLEIRPGAEYGDQGDTFNLGLERSFDTNDRLSKQFAIIVSQSTGVSDGETFRINDGLSEATFEFDIDPIGPAGPNGVAQGNIPVPVSLQYNAPTGNSNIVARAIRDAINKQKTLKITAALRGQMIGLAGNELQRSDSNIVELFVDPSLTSGITMISSDTSFSPALKDAFGPNPIDPTGLFPTFYPPVQIAGFNEYGRDAMFGTIPFGEDLGDSNRYRDQGQILISSNSISHSSNFGIDVGIAPVLSANRNLVTLNTENLAPGIVIINNVLDQNGFGGISIAGANATARGTPPSTVARVINNTIFGGDTPNGVGIRVTQNASPTLMNNILAGNVLGISSAGTTTVAGGNLFYNNLTNATVAGSFDIALNLGDPLFVSTLNGRFYPASFSQAIDSSIASLPERPGLTSVKSGIQRTPNPIIAPDRDVSGLARKDDPFANTPAGQGQNVFIDRGAVDRTDSQGPQAVLTRPLDDDASGVDLDRNTISQPNGYVKLKQGAAPINFFEILLNENLGIGPEPLSVLFSNILLTENGRLLRPVVDYEFGYSVNKRTIRFTPLSGFWRQDSVYEITLNNKPRLRINATGGETLTDGTQLTATLPSGLPVTLEYETGFALQVPQTSTLVIPSIGSSTGGVTDGQTFAISYGLPGAPASTINFELDTDGFTAGNNTKVTIPRNASAMVVRDAILNTLLSPIATVLQLSPKAVGTSEIHLGTGANHNVIVTGSNLVLNGVLSGVEDGQTFKYRSGVSPEVTFEFNSDGLLTAPGIREIAFSKFDTFDEIASKVAVALSSVVIGPTPVRNVARGVVHVGGQLGDSLDLSLSALRLLGSPGVSGKLQLLVPFGGAGFVDGQTFSIQTAAGLTTFEFTNDPISSISNIPVSITNVDTAATVAGKVVSAIIGANLGFTPTLSGPATVALNEPLGTGFNIETAPFTVSGVAGGALSVPVIPAIDFTAEMVAGQIAKVLNSLPSSQFANVHATGIGGRSLIVDGLTSITNIQGVLLAAVVDLAGNPLQANRPNGQTQFTIAMPEAQCDFGDAPSPFSPTLIGDNGARHVIFPADEATLMLGVHVDPESNAQPTLFADGDDNNGTEDDEDGIHFVGFFNPNSPAVSIQAAVSGVGYLDAWIDWNGDGDFFDANEKIIDSQPVTTGLHRFTQLTPSTAVPGDRVARFRLSSTGGLFPSGMAVGGEVEDYLVRIFNGQPPVAVDDSGSNYTIIEDPSSPLVVAVPGVLANDTGQSISVFDSNPSIAGVQPASGPSFGTLILNANGSFQYAPNANFSGTDTFTYFAVDPLGLGSVNPATVTITVTPINDIPEFTLPTSSLSLTEDQGADSLGNPGTISFTNFATGIRPGPAGSNSEDNQVLTFNLVANDPTLFAIQPAISNNGTLTFALARDRNSTFQGFDGRVRVTLVDDGSNTSPNSSTSATATFTINIAALNDPPSLDGFSATVSEDSTTSYTSLSVLVGDLPGPATAIDEVGQAVSIVAMETQSANGGTVIPFFSGSTIISFNYSPAANFVGADTFTYTVTDNASPTPTTTVGTITINVSAVNDAPVFSIPTVIHVDEDQGSTINGSVQTQVPISLPGTVTGISPGPNGAVDEVGQNLTFDVVVDHPSFFEVQPTITRSQTNPSEATLTFTLAKQVNRDFVNGGNNRIRITARDDGSSVSPNVNASVTTTISIDIAPINDAPVPDSFAPTVEEDSATNFTAAQVLAGDTAGPADASDEQLTQTLSITRIDQRSSRGGVINQTGAGSITGFRYIPALNFVGTDTFTYTLSDNVSGSPKTAMGTVTVTVTAVNDAPEFTSGSTVAANEDSGAYSQAWATNVLAGPSNALDENAGSPIQTVSFEVSTTNASLFKTLPSIDASGVLKFESTRNANGNAVVTVTAIDSGSGVAPNVNRSATVTFTIAITPVNDAPTFISGGDVTVAEDAGAVNQNWATSILAAGPLAFTPPEATDESSQTVGFVVTSISNTSLFSVQPAVAADGKLSFTTAANASGSTLVTIVARDNGPSATPNANDSIPVTITINVTSVNDAPVGVSDRYQTTEDAQFISVAGQEVVVNDFDPDDSRSDFSIVPGNSLSTQGAAVTMVANGSFTYDPRSAALLQKLLDGATIDDTFTYRLQDIHGAISLPVTVTVTVQGTNDAPTTVNDILGATPNATTSLNVLANDTDPETSSVAPVHKIDETSVQIGVLPTNGTVAVQSNGRVNYTPNAGFRGSDSFTYRVRDSLGLLSNEGTVTVRINNVPIALADRASVLSQASVVINVLSNDSDADGNSTINRSSVTIVASSANGTATVLPDGTIRFTPATGFTGSTTFSYSIKDTENPPSESAPGVVTVDVVKSLYQNPGNRYDVNADGFVSPIDALIVINDIQRRGSRLLQSGDFTPPPFIDVDGSSSVEPLDVLQVINFLNSQSRRSAGEGEGHRLIGMSTPALTTSSLSTTIDVVTVTPEQIISAVGARVVQDVRQAVVAAAINSESIAESDDDESMIRSLAGSTTLRKRSHQTDAAFADSLNDLWES